MLNIEDIEKRLRDNPEPPFVKEVRENIRKSFSRLEFIEEGHKYFVHNDDGTQTELPSVSHVCHQFQNETDWDWVANNKAKKMGIDVKDLKRQWKEANIRSTSNGTKTHLFGESYMYFFRGKPDLMPQSVKETQYEEGFLIPYGTKEEAIAKFYEDAFSVKNFYPVMAEAKIYTGINETLKLRQNYSGTFDMLFAYQLRNRWKLAIFDWKTNKELENSYNRDFGNGLKQPFGHLIDEPLSLYTLQLSSYQLGLMQLGYEIADRKIVWLKDDTSYEKIQTKDVTKQLIKALS
jgi:hypothetical protein